MPKNNQSVRNKDARARYEDLVLLDFTPADEAQETLQWVYSSHAVNMAEAV